MDAKNGEAAAPWQERAASSGRSNNQTIPSVTEAVRDSGPPTLNCRLNRITGTITLERCPGCGATHWHGDGDAAKHRRVGDLLGHRWSHCVDRGVLPRGYFLRAAEIVSDPPKRPTRRPQPRWEKRVVAFDQAERIVAKVAPSDPRTQLARVVPDLAEVRPLALCDSRRMEIRVPLFDGVTLGSLVSELALLSVPGLGFESPLHDPRNYERHRAALAKQVLAAAGVSP